MPKTQMGRRAGATLGFVGPAILLSACSTVGVTSIDHGRTPYNVVIQDTAKEQTLLNIVRVSRSESPLFLDVTEVDQVNTVSGSISGGPSGIGATANRSSASAGTLAGLVGAVTGAASYQEAPTVRYIPLAGQPLIAQVSTPINPEALANLFTSDWPPVAILDLGVDRITPGWADYDVAVNAIAELDAYGAIIVTATPSEDKDKAVHFRGLTFQASQPPVKDSLTIYREDRNIAAFQKRCDGNVDAKLVVDAAWTRLEEAIDQHGPVISLQSKGSPNIVPGGKARPPLLATRSALGIMKAAAEQDDDPTIAIQPIATIREIVAERQATKGPCSQWFYTLDPLRYAWSVMSPEANGISERALREVSALARTPNRSLITARPTARRMGVADREVERALVSARRFMLVGTSASPPPDAFVTVEHEGVWYSILQEDEVSKRTLALINQFNTILAVPGQAQPLLPTISVGARG